MTIIAPLANSKSEMICSQCGDMLIAPEESYEFSEEGIVIKLWSCYCGNHFETDEKIGLVVADVLLAA
jgi:hypothetical protein